MFVNQDFVRKHNIETTPLLQPIPVHNMDGTPNENGLVSGERPVPVRPGSVSTGIDPMRREPASLEGPSSLLSQRPKRSVGTLQGLTCD